MNSSFCLGSCSCSCTATNTSLPFFPPGLPLYQSLSSNAESSAVKFSRNNNISSTACSRREAIGLGLGLCFCLAEAVIKPPPTSAAAAETISCEFTEATSGLAFCDKVLGLGPQAEKGQLIKAHYIGKLVDGTVFDSSYRRGKPLTFRVGVGEVIKGWDEGILGGDGIPPMTAGGKRSLKIPPELAYGLRGAGCRGGSCIIPPNSVLLFDVEFVGKV